MNISWTSVTNSPVKMQDCVNRLEGIIGTIPKEQIIPDDIMN
jgi:hypothetical protein